MKYAMLKCTNYSLRGKPVKCFKVITKHNGNTISPNSFATRQDAEKWIMRNARNSKNLEIVEYFHGDTGERMKRLERVETKEELAEFISGLEKLLANCTDKDSPNGK